MKKWKVCFQSFSGTLEVSHFCSDDEVHFWEREGYIVRPK